MYVYHNQISIHEKTSFTYKPLHFFICEAIYMTLGCFLHAFFAEPQQSLKL